MKHEEVRAVVDKLAVEKGKRLGRNYFLTCSVKEVLDKLGAKNTEDNQRYIRYVINAHYDKVIFSPGQGSNGGFVKLRIRGN